MMRCNEGKRVIDTHPARDTASPAAAASLKVAAFKNDTRVQCKCAAGECNPDACDELRVLDSQGSKIATFHGRGWQATSDGNVLTVFRIPGSATKDARRRMTLADLNRINREFYAVHD